MKTSHNTPVLSFGSGEYLRDQTRRDSRQAFETLHTCPVEGCVGGQIRTEKETGTIYSVQLETCDLCLGTGVVSKRVAVEYLALVG